MSCFLDTSALYAILDADDRNHSQSSRLFADLLQLEMPLVCSDYILIETFALVQSRLGMDAVRTLSDDILPVLRVFWTDEQLFGSALSACLAANRKRLRLVDCVSFAMMRQRGISRVFTFDSHFAEQGFYVVGGNTDTTRESAT